MKKIYKKLFELDPRFQKNVRHNNEKKHSKEDESINHLGLR